MQKGGSSNQDLNNHSGGYWYKLDLHLAQTGWSRPLASIYTQFIHLAKLISFLSGSVLFLQNKPFLLSGLISVSATKFSMSINSFLPLLCGLSGKFFQGREKELENFTSCAPAAFSLRTEQEDFSFDSLVYKDNVQEEIGRTYFCFPNLLRFSMRKEETRHSDPQTPGCFRTMREVVSLSL